LAKGGTHEQAVAQFTIADKLVTEETTAAAQRVTEAENALRGQLAGERKQDVELEPRSARSDLRRLESVRSLRTSNA
jgi:hypothetical protein